VTRPQLSLAVAVTLLLVTFGVATQIEPASPATPARTEARFVPVARAVAACPDPVADARSATSVSVAAPGAIDSRTSGRSGSAGAASGRATVVPLGRSSPVTGRLSAVGSTVVDVTAPATGSGAEAAADPRPLLARASGALAPGLDVTMTTRSTADDLRGLLSDSCVTPGTEFWFVGSGAVVGQRGRVYLTNSEPVPAQVDVTLYGPNGLIDAPSGRGVTIAAGQQQVLKLDALAPDVERFGIHVEVRQGRIAAAVRDQQVAGLTPRGADWVPAAESPSRRLVLPGVLSGQGERRLQVLVPGDTDAIVRVRLVGSDGSFVPSGLDVVEARAGRVTDIDLASYTGGRAVAVALTSDQPVTAGLLMRVGGGPAEVSEIAYTAAAAALRPRSPGVLPDLRAGTADAADAGDAAGKGPKSTIVLAAPDGEATVLIAALPPATGEPMRVTVPEGSQVTVAASELSTAAQFAVSLVPQPGSGPVMVGSQTTEDVTDGSFVTSSVVRPVRYAVRVPRVAADLSTGLRQRGQ
jgi:hypothetical protein